MLCRRAINGVRPWLRSALVHSNWLKQLSAARADFPLPRNGSIQACAASARSRHHWSRSLSYRGPKRKPLSHRVLRQSAGGSFLPDVASCCYQKPHQLIISRLYQAPAFKLDGESNGLAMLGEQDTGGFVAGDVARERFVARILRQNNRERSVGRGAGH